MTSMLLDKLAREKIVAIIRGVNEKDVLPVTEALLEGGICFVEVTLDHTHFETIPLASRMIKSLCNEFSGAAHFGVGTVLAPYEAEAMVEAGAQYIISPNTNLQVIRRTKELNAVSIPGAMTPSEIAAAYEAGADIIKLFPTGNLGLSYINAVRAPLAHIPLMATGGVTVENICDFLRAGCVSVGIGGNLVNAGQVAKKNYSFIAQEARKYVSALGNCSK